MVNEHLQVSSRPRAALAAQLCIAFLAIIAPAFLGDDVVFFNYLNNVEDARALFYYGGYVQFMPELTAYVLSPLPLAAQAVLYRVVPLAVVLFLYRETVRVLALAGSRRDAGLLALSFLVILWSVEASTWSTIGGVAWMALLAATLVVIRVNAQDGRYTVMACAGVVLTGVSFPVGGQLVWPLLLFAATAGDRISRSQNAAIAATIAIAQLALASGSPDPIWNPHFSDAPRLFLSGFREHKAMNLIAIGSVVTLAAAFAWGWRHDAWHGASRRAMLLALGALCLVGGTTVLAYVASSRFVRYEGGFQGRHVLPVLFCALVAGGYVVLASRRDEARLLAVGAVLGLAGTLAAAGLYSRLRGPLELALMKYQFVAASDNARANCREEEVFVFEDESSSPVIFCRPRPVSPTEFYLTDFIPAVGEFDPDTPLEDRPFVLAPKPLF